MAGSRTTVDRPANVIPQCGLQLPLIDQARRVAFECDRRIDSDHAPDIVVYVQQDLARGHTHGGCRFPASLWALDKHRPGGLQQFRQLGVDDSWQVVHSLACSHCEK